MTCCKPGDLGKVWIFITFLFLVALPCCEWVFSGYGQWGLLFRCRAQASHWSDFSCCRARALGCSGFTNCSKVGSVVAAHGFSCSLACGIFPDQGPNQCLLRWLTGGFFITEPPTRPNVSYLHNDRRHRRALSQVPSPRRSVPSWQPRASAGLTQHSQACSPSS